MATSYYIDELAFKILCLFALFSYAFLLLYKVKRPLTLPIIIPLLVIAWYFACIAYGFIFFIDAPYRTNTPMHPCAQGQFCGKTGHPHTQKEYDAFVLWQEIFIFSAPFGFIAGVYLWTQQKKLGVNYTES